MLWRLSIKQKLSSCHKPEHYWLIILCFDIWIRVFCFSSFINLTSHFQGRKSNRLSGTRHVHYGGTFSWRAIYTSSTRQPSHMTLAYLAPCPIGPWLVLCTLSCKSSSSSTRCSTAVQECWHVWTGSWFLCLRDVWPRYISSQTCGSKIHHGNVGRETFCFPSFNSHITSINLGCRGDGGMGQKVELHFQL